MAEGQGTGMGAEAGAGTAAPSPRGSEGCTGKPAVPTAPAPHPSPRKLRLPDG